MAYGYDKVMRQLEKRTYSTPIVKVARICFTCKHTGSQIRQGGQLGEKVRKILLHIFVTDFNETFSHRV